MYFSFRRICSILERLHSVFPRGVSTFRRSRASLIWRRLRPSRNRLKIILMCSASSGTISGSPSSPFLYPSILEYGKAKAYSKSEEKAITKTNNLSAKAGATNVTSNNGYVGGCFGGFYPSSMRVLRKPSISGGMASSGCCTGWEGAA